MLLFTVVSPDSTPPIDLGFPSLPQQEMMELFVANLRTQYFRDSHGNFLDKCTWGGIGCNDAGDVTIVSWETSTLNPLGLENIGFVDFRWVPPTVELLELHRIPFRFFGAEHLPKAARTIELKPGGFVTINSSDARELKTSGLPKDLRVFLAGAQRFEGSVDFETLPNFLENLAIERNDFSGEVKLTNLPDDILRCTMHFNQFSGSVDLTQLPPSLGLLTLHANSFSGYLNIKGTSEKVREQRLRSECFQVADNGMHLYFHDNDFDGALGYSGAAPGGIYARDNRFTFIVWLSMSQIHKLDASCNRLQGSLCISEIPNSLEQIDLSENMLSGTIDFQCMPAGVKLFNVAHNSLTGAVEFGKYSPENIFMNENSFTSLKIRKNQNLGKIFRLDLSNNAIVQETVHIGVFDSLHYLRYINLQGNSINRCLYKGKLTSLKRVYYDNSTSAQRGKFK